MKRKSEHIIQMGHSTYITSDEHLLGIRKLIRDPLTDFVYAKPFDRLPRQLEWLYDFFCSAHDKLFRGSF
jgi:hypothetical protein